MRKNEKEHLFYDTIRGIIECSRKYKLLEKGLICMGKTDHNAHSVYQLGVNPPADIASGRIAEVRVMQLHDAHLAARMPRHS